MEDIVRAWTEQPNFKYLHNRLAGEKSDLLDLYLKRHGSITDEDEKNEWRRKWDIINDEDIESPPLKLSSYNGCPRIKATRTISK